MTTASLERRNACPGERLHGGGGTKLVLADRPVPGSQIAPVVDASSAQSRADVVVIFMSAVLLLTGLQWAVNI